MAVAGFVAGRITGTNAAMAEAEARALEYSPVSAYLPPKAGSTRPSSSTSDSNQSSTRKIQLSGHDMSYALGKAMAEPNPVNRMAAMSQLLSGLDANNLDAALSVFKNIPIRLDNKDEYAMLLYSWAQFDGANAIEYVAENLNARGLPGGELRRAALSGWASQDPAKAVEWLDAKMLSELEQSGKKLEEGAPVPIEADYAAALIKGWASVDPYAAAEFLGERFQHGKEREALMGHIASSLIKDSPQTATQWAESFDNAELKEEAFEELAEDWSTIDPAATGAWLAQHINEGYSKEAVEDLARGWAVKDLDSAVRWFETLDDGLTRGTGIQKLMEIWSNQDTEASGEWLVSLPEGSIGRDMGVSAYAKEVARDNPEAAAQWLDTIQDDNIRQQAAPEVLKNWMGHDPEGAMQWAQENNVLPAEELQKLQQRQGQMRQVIVDGQPMSLPIDQIRSGLSEGLPPGAIIEHSAEGIHIEADGKTFDIPKSLSTELEIEGFHR